MTKDVRHPLFDELDAFDPNWQNKYPDLRTAVEAAAEQTHYVKMDYMDWLSTPEGIAYTEQVASVPDMKGYIEECQKAEEESPYFKRAMNTWGFVGGNEWYWQVEKEQDE